jgi:UDP-N-acetylmuramate--alanine ligase
MTYGFSPACDVYAENIQICNGVDRFDCFFKGKKLGAVQLAVPGRHNVLNAMACICVGLNFSLDFGLIAESFLSFEGVNRRFQVKAKVDDILVVDDYGHHPTEIAATLATARSLERPRVLTVFQPHRYTRTKFLMNEFVSTLLAADHLILTDIYAASEPAIEGVTAQSLCERLTAAGHPDVTYVKKEEIPAHLLARVRSGDLVLTLGAGDITRIGEEFVLALTQKFATAGEKTL